MGRKQDRTGKYFLFCLTGLTLLFFTGCTFFEKVPEKERPVISSAEKEKIRQREALAAAEKQREENARTHLSRGRAFFARGNWEGALLEIQMILTYYQQGKTMVEEALFIQGLIYLHPDNPKRDSGKAMESLKRLIKEYPNSFFTQQAKAWVELLVMQEKSDKENEKLTRDHEKLTRDLEKISKMLEEYKKVDIEVEKKKREKGR